MAADWRNSPHEGGRGLRRTGRTRASDVRPGSTAPGGPRGSSPPDLAHATAAWVRLERPGHLDLQVHAPHGAGALAGCWWRSGCSGRSARAPLRSNADLLDPGLRSRPSRKTIRRSWTVDSAMTNADALVKIEPALRSSKTSRSSASVEVGRLTEPPSSGWGVGGVGRVICPTASDTTAIVDMPPFPRQAAAGPGRHARSKAHACRASTTGTDASCARRQTSVIRSPAWALYRRFTEMRLAVKASTWCALRSRPP